MHKRRNRKQPARIKLTDCVMCKQPFAYPVLEDSHEVGENHWLVTLRCGNCLHVYETVITQGAANLLEDDQDAYEDMMIQEAKRLDAEDLDRAAGLFARALELDLITADDFRL